MSKLLAFDTSTELMSIALCLPDGVRVHESEGGAQASARLVPEILRLMVSAQLRLDELDAFAFGCGPGAFTGLRTACSVVQGLAFGVGKPVVPVDSLLLVAEDARQQFAAPRGDAEPLDVGVAMDARMNEIYAGIYRWNGAAWSVLSAPALCTAEALNASPEWRRHALPAVVAGSALVAFGSAVEGGTLARLPAPRSRAQALAALARQQWAAGATVDAADALPIYLRDKVAQTTAEREAARAEKDLAA